jgi:hypothetical protein
MADQYEALLKEIRERYDYATEAWRKIREEASKDMRYVAGDAWDPKERKARQDAGRPCISLDEISQYTNQVINQLRAKRRGVMFSANGDGADEKTAEFYADKWREVEYRSKAQIVYTTAAQNAIERSYGFCRLKTKYVSDRSFNQEIWLEEIVNPDTVLPDPDAKRPTFSDQQYLFLHETRKKEEFKREFPKAKIQDFPDSVHNLAPSWIKGDEITIAEYWKIAKRERELLLLRVPTGETMEVYADEVQSKRVLDLVVKRRPVDVPQVCMYLTNGVEILGDKTEWPGKYIPFAACVGKVIYLDTGAGIERQILSMVRLMRDPQMLNAYLRTNEAELVGMTPKTPYIGYVGQFRTRGEQWAKLNHEPVPFIEADPLTEATGNTVLPLPTRAAYEPPIQALEILAESSRRSIQASAGSMPLPTAAQRRNEKSGVALKQMDDIAQVGSYHYSDHYDDMIEHIGVMGEDLMDKIYDTAREVAVRKANDVSEMRRINDPADPKSVSTKGSHLVTVSTGPTFDSTREAVKDLANTLLTGPDPEVTRAVMPVAIKMMNLGAESEELIEIAEALQPPAIQQLKQKDGEEPDPKQLMQQIGQMKEQIQLAQQAMQELAKEAEGKQLDARTKVEVAQIGAEKDKAIAADRNLTDLEKTNREIAARIHIAEIAARTKGVEMAHEAEHEAVAMAHEVAMSDTQAQRDAEGAEADREHEVALTGAQAETEAEQAEAQRAHEAQLTQAQLEAAAEQAAQGEAGA